VALMRRAPLLDHLQPDQLRLLYAIGVERRLPPRTVLGYGGKVIESMWVILEGEIEIDSPLTRGATTLRGPETWGSASLVPPFMPNGTAVTVTDCRMVQIDSSDIRALIEQSPRLGVDLYLALSTNVFRRIRILTNAAAHAQTLRRE
jgi:CRP-like cAMP-binding protein